MGMTRNRHRKDDWSPPTDIDWLAEDDVEDKGEGYGRLVGLCLFALGALLVVVVTGMRIDGVTLWEAYMKSGTTAASAASRFAGLSFGAPVGSATRLRPDLALSPGAGGELVGTYEAEGTHYTVAFLDGEHGRKAYRFRTLRLVERAAERDIVAAMIDEYGKPASSECSNPVYASGRFCRRTWMTKGGVFIEVVCRVIGTVDGREHVELATTYVDIYLEGRRRRAGGEVS